MDNIIANLLQEIEESRQRGIPLGYIFQPTDVELLDYYLLPRIKGEQLPSDSIMDLDVFQYDPQQLPLDQFKHTRENEAYFFTREERRNSLGDASIRPTQSGYWKVQEENTPIYRANEIIGFKNKLFFYTGRDPNGSETDWRMIEYEYNQNMVQASSTTSVEIKNYIACRIWLEGGIEEEEECLVEELLQEESGSSEDN